MQVLEGTSPLKMEKKKKITAEIVATTSLPVDRLTATDCNAAARAMFRTISQVILPYHSLTRQILLFTVSKFDFT